jgi:undecaprenyl-diphosphatase
MLGWGDPGVSFSAVIQLGSIAAVLWYFWSDLTGLAVGAFRALQEKEYGDRDFRIAIGIALGTLPIVILGLGIKFNATIAEFYDTKVRSLLVIGIVSIVMGLLLGIAEMLGKRLRNFEQLTLKDGILMGCAQALAIIPGVSRSGSTITSGLFMGLERATAARFSFLLGIPAITLAGLVELKDLLTEGVGGVGMAPLIAGLISSVVFSYGAIAWLIKFLQTQNTWVFVWYRLIFGLGILIVLGGHVSWTVGQ